MTGRAASPRVGVWGEVPESTDRRVAGRDRSPLPPDALLRFQAINRGRSPHANHRWELHNDGRLFVAWHSEDTESSAPFDDLPAAPTAVLPPATVEELRGLLGAEDFGELAPYQLAPDAEDGMWRIVTARLDGRVHEVMYEAVGTPLLERLQRIASQVSA